MNYDNLPTENMMRIENVHEVTKDLTHKTRRRSKTRFSAASTASLTFLGCESWMSTGSDTSLIPKVVEFTLIDDVHIVPSVIEFTKEEIQSYWYSPKELEVLISQHEDITDKNFESHKHVIRTLLKHQRNHNETGMKDENCIRMHSRASRERRERAREAANQRALMNLATTLLAPV